MGRENDMNPYTPSSECAFTLGHYTYILLRMKDSGYSPISFMDRKGPAFGKVLIRHDVDVSPTRALRMARLEESLDIHSTYFILASSPMYNPTEPKYRSVFSSIAGMGHWLGLHVDERHDMDVAEQCEQLYSFLKAYLPMERVVSLHRPRQWLGRHVSGFVSAYEPRFFQHIRYVSDSRRIWRQGCPCSLISASPPPRRDPVQILVHPEWWSVGTNESFEKLARCFASERERDCWRYFSSISPFHDIAIARLGQEAQYEDCD